MYIHILPGAALLVSMYIRLGWYLGMHACMHVYVYVYVNVYTNAGGHSPVVYNYVGRGRSLASCCIVKNSDIQIASTASDFGGEDLDEELHTFTYIYIYIHIYTLGGPPATYTHMYTSTCMPGWAPGRIHVYIYIHIYVDAYSCMPGCGPGHMYMYTRGGPLATYMYTYIYTWGCTCLS